MSVEEKMKEMQSQAAKNSDMLSSLKDKRNELKAELIFVESEIQIRTVMADHYTTTEKKINDEFGPKPRKADDRRFQHPSLRNEPHNY